MAQAHGNHDETSQEGRVIEKKKEKKGLLKR